MHLVRPQHLGKTVAVTASNRPIKIAYLVPPDETPLTHLILDAVFFESYTRWGGVYTLIIPSTPGHFSTTDYEDWLEFFDPDFVYTYVSLDDSFVKRLDRRCAPMAFLTHRPLADEANIHWRAFLPKWDHHFSAVSSMSTVSSPFLQQTLFSRHPQQNAVSVVTQYDAPPEDRFVRDNYGVAFDTHTVTHSVPGVFTTLCLVDPDLSTQIVVGTERCTSIPALLTAVNTRKSIPIARFATLHSEGIAKPSSHEWSHNLNIFIGESALDRINFWNARHFTPSDAGAAGAIIVGKHFFDQEEQVNLLGQYLNANNYSHGNGPAIVALRSLSETKEELANAREKLQRHTHNVVQVRDTYNVAACPTQPELNHNAVERSLDSTTFKITDNQNKIVAIEPEHFAFLPARFRGAAHGNWVVMLDIERHNNLSQYSNVVDRWQLPKRQKLARAFTSALGKVSQCHRLCLIPKTPGLRLRQIGQAKYSYDLHLPDDETFFQHLLTKFSTYSEPDRRAGLENSGYENISISDKGENLRGIISMFESLSEAYEILTNKYWREVIRCAKEESVRYLIHNDSTLWSLIPNDRAFREKFRTDMRLENNGQVIDFTKANLLDTLEYLITRRIFFQVHLWRCGFCGHSNCRSFDDMKIKNACEICSTGYFAPVDTKWDYQLNEFVRRTLVTSDGLPVLWALGHLQDYLAYGSFWFLPEVDLYNSVEPVNKNEIDIICVADGKLLAVEAKLTASQFQKPNEIEKFIDKIQRIQPDIAMLVFERYCVNEDDTPAIKAFLHSAMETIHAAIGPQVQLKLIIASDLESFREHPRYLGYIGSRTHAFN